MKLFLTSAVLSHTGGPFNPSNGFVDNLRNSIPSGCQFVYISSNPDDLALNDSQSESVLSAFKEIGIEFKETIIIDSRISQPLSDIFCGREDQVVVLASGDVFSQNLFFHKIELKKYLKDFKGVLIASGGGAMNCSSVLYVMPRTLDQAFSPKFAKFLPGLGFTNRAIIPHYEQVRGKTLGNLRYMEDVILSDSIGKSFYALPDGTYIEYDNGFESIHGPAWHVHDGELSLICCSFSES